MKPALREDLRKYMEQYATRILTSRKGKVEAYYQEAEECYPFHALFIPVEALVLSKLERSIFSAVGQSFYPALAKRILASKEIESFPSYTFKQEIDVGMLNAAEKLVDDLDRNKREPDPDREVTDVIASGNGVYTTVEFTADLYIPNFDGRKVLLEFKTPWPKKEDCVRSKRRLILFRVCFRDESPLAYVAYPYNPFGPREKFHWTAEIFFDMGKEVKAGKELWDWLGGAGTFEELKSLSKEVGKEVRERVGLFDSSKWSNKQSKLNKFHL